MANNDICSFHYIYFHHLLDKIKLVKNKKEKKESFFFKKKKDKGIKNQ